MGEEPGDFPRNLLLAPIGVLRPKPGSLEIAGGPVELLRQRKSALWRHLAEDLQLFGTRLFVRQHDHSMDEQTQSGKLLPRSTANKAGAGIE